MNLPEIPKNSSRQEMRKALIRLRMEMHRQEMRHESRQMLEPLQRVRGMTHSFQEGLGIKHAPLWGIAAVTLLGFLTAKGAKGGAISSVTRLVQLGTSLLPLIKLVLQGSSRKDP
ncbi:hypothetical protein C1Y08_11600 [Pseudomonas sp. FW306-02-F02-AA]|uniref:Uncharacterized protein n=1 Tax=Pseudomonas fluorescens TaxID=294 RepID=A0A0N9W841_PSEFL|nr:MULTISPECIES: hypothetical protein [Pseudomonas]ALI03106.1 hypothetical protein AO353_19205 [Pseudomonas fluorescens]PMZ04035.1 hypothetical protein C1Y07_10685 [Pseudomonas sp. FW306-02-F02-AB]PMZ10190.1 hypothetical protein C1Y06_09410 [Pseudomonas sp. FW306-02-H06C]PMZ15617.1 hypothetical protein C1Y08_11600 [Pseudomonas sp. FW306-02-F02-AA]PMZ18356.1 hypothetical protein C1Y09_29695 [Pseudomonas sp. FW306-02-F08-AA]